MGLVEFSSVFMLDGIEARVTPDSIHFGSVEIPMAGGIPRFVRPGETYSDGNFSELRKKHATLQLDSVNGTTDRRMTLLSRTNWEPTRLRDKLVLECGCGAGPDTEVLLSLGGRVLAADLAGVDVARNNLGDRPQLCLIQADIMNLPLRPATFDTVFCHRVLQHTPDPERTLRHILTFVKPDGDVFVHSYAKTAKQMWNWKYVLRPLSTRMSPETLYSFIKRTAPALMSVSEAMCRSAFGRRIHYVMVPFRYYGHKEKFRTLTREQILEYGIHDTFDALAPRYDRPLSAKKIRAIASEYLSRPFEVVESGAVTLLRTL